MGRRPWWRGHGRENYCGIERQSENGRRIGAWQVIVVIVTKVDRNMRCAL